MECMYHIGLWQLCCLNGAPTTPLVTIVMTKIVASVLGKNNLLGSIFTAFCGGAAGCQAITMDTRILLVLFTGSSKVGLAVQQTVSKRFGKCLLELSGNSAIIIMGDADIKLDVRSVFFAAVGTAGRSDLFYMVFLDCSFHFRCVGKWR